MSAFKITHISNIDQNNSQSISFQLDSEKIPYGMQENFVIMEKIPDYLFHYISLMFINKHLQKTYELNKSSKSITIDITETTFDTNHTQFFDNMKKLLYIIEEHFPIIVQDLHSFDNPDSFLQKIDKLGLYNKLQINLSEKNQPIRKIKI